MRNLSRTYAGKFLFWLLALVFLTLAAAGALTAKIRTDNDGIDLTEKQKDYIESVLSDFAVSLVGDYTSAEYWDSKKGQYTKPGDSFAENEKIVYYLENYENGAEIKSRISEDGKSAEKNWDYINYFHVRKISGRDLIAEVTESNLKTLLMSHYPNSIPGQALVVKLKYLKQSNDFIPTEDAVIDFVVEHTHAIPIWIFVMIAFVSAVLFLGCFIVLMCASARKPLRKKKADKTADGNVSTGSAQTASEESAFAYAKAETPEGLYPGPLNLIPFDILLLVCAVLIAVPTYIGRKNVEYDFDLASRTVYYCMLSIIGAGMAIGLCMSGAARIKQRNIISNSALYKLVKAIWKVVRRLFSFLLGGLKKLVEGIAKLPLIPKTAAILFFSSSYFLLCGIIMLAGYKISGIRIFGFIMLLCGIAAFVIFITYYVLEMKKLTEAAKLIAGGKEDMTIDTNGLPEELARHADSLNNISKGIGLAVEERMKSERMKTELITNVTHDLKTPLTSIINYSDLISKEKSDNPKITEYSEVLCRQSDRLKRLIEDLVEASKASSGNLEVEMADCEAALFINQTAGEYEERFAERGLKIVTKNTAEDNPHIMADGRRMLRIFDNLMSNIYKYAKEDTRVYLSLAEEYGSETPGKHVVFTFKNTSEAELDVTEEDLMERFVRGDLSRNTDGNGLGLSIAKSLTELQNGSLSISIDGDLFKAELRFPAVG